jgi:hypothetical protein
MLPDRHRVQRPLLEMGLLPSGKNNPSADSLQGILPIRAFSLTRSTPREAEIPDYPAAIAALIERYCLAHIGGFIFGVVTAHLFEDPRRVARQQSTY